MKTTRMVRLANIQGLMLKYLWEAPFQNFFPAYELFSKGLEDFPEEFPEEPHPLFEHLHEVFDQVKEGFFSPRKPEGSLSEHATWVVQEQQLHLQVDGVIFFTPSPLLKQWTRLWELGKHWDPNKLPVENGPLVRFDWGHMDLEGLASLKHPIAILYFCQKAEGWAEVNKWSTQVEAAGIRIDPSFIPRWKVRLENILEEYFWSARGNFSQVSTQVLDMTFPLNKAASLLNAFGLNLFSPTEEEIGEARKLIEKDLSPFAFLLRGVGEWPFQCWDDFKNVPSTLKRHFDLGKVNQTHIEIAVAKGNRFAMWLLARKKMLFPPNEETRNDVVRLLEEAATRSWRAQKNLAEMGYRFPFLHYKTLRELGGSFECTSTPPAWQDASMSMLVHEFEEGFKRIPAVQDTLQFLRDEYYRLWGTKARGKCASDARWLRNKIREKLSEEEEPSEGEQPFEEEEPFEAEEPSAKRPGETLSTSAKRRKKNPPLGFYWVTWAHGDQGKHRRRLHLQSHLKGKGQTLDLYWEGLLRNPEFEGQLEDWAHNLKFATHTMFKEKVGQILSSKSVTSQVLRFFENNIVFILRRAASDAVRLFTKGVSFTMFAEWYLLPFKPPGGWSVSWNDFQRLNQGRQVTTGEHKLFCSTGTDF